MGRQKQLYILCLRDIEHSLIMNLKMLQFGKMQNNKFTG